MNVDRTPQACARRNGAPIYTRMAGWGQRGPLAARAGHDINYLAVTGALSSIGRTDTDRLIADGVVRQPESSH